MALGRSLVVISLFAVLGCHAMVTYTSAAEHRAQEFLRNDPDPDSQGMNELQATNPEAFAIVQALLTKRSLGMLNLKHPSASFKPGANDAPQQEGPSAVEVLQASEGQHASSVSAEVPVEVPVSEMSLSAPRSHKNWLNWKPHDDDDAMVKNVLGAVADLKSGGAPQAQEETAETPPVQEQPVAAPPAVEPSAMAPPAVANVAPPVEQQPATQQNVHPPRLGALSFDWGNRYGKEEATAAAPSQPQWATASRATPTQQVQAPPSQDSANPYLKGIDFSSDLGAPVASMSQQNSYLRGSGLDAAAAPAKHIAMDNGPNKLASFDWYSDNDSDKTNTQYLQQSGADAKQSQSQEDAKPADVQPGDNLVNGALAGWLNH